jgi:hypothetical protein
VPYLLTTYWAAFDNFDAPDEQDSEDS